MQKLNLRRCCIIEDVGIIASADLSENLVGRSVRDIAEALPKSNLQDLALYSASLGSEGAKCLASALIVDATHLKKLDICNNNVGDAGAIEFANALSQNFCALKWLSLSNNHVVPAGAKRLASALFVNYTLEEIRKPRQQMMTQANRPAERGEINAHGSATRIT